jgi:hypothetical protein
VPFIEIFIRVPWIAEAKKKQTGQYPDEQLMLCLEELCNIVYNKFKVFKSGSLLESPNL